jgi:hypothetical protein
MTIGPPRNRRPQVSQTQPTATLRADQLVSRALGERWRWCPGRSFDTPLERLVQQEATQRFHVGREVTANG